MHEYMPWVFYMSRGNQYQRIIAGVNPWIRESGGCQYKWHSFINRKLHARFDYSTLLSVNTPAMKTGISLRRNLGRTVEWIVDLQWRLYVVLSWSTKIHQWSRALLVWAVQYTTPTTKCFKENIPVYCSHTHCPLALQFVSGTCI